MTIHPAAAYLIRFDAPAPPAPAEFGANNDAPVLEALFTPAPAFEIAPPPEPLRSEEEIRAEAEAKFLEALEKERESFEQRLRDERARWAAEQAEAVTRKLMRAHEDAMASLRGDITRILCPFLSREIVDNVVDDLIIAVRQGLSNESAPAVTVTAPKDLLEKIQQMLKAENIAVAARESDHVDAHVAFASTIVESRLGEWIGKLSAQKSEFQ